jgi:hypothetical protein
MVHYNNAAEKRIRGFPVAPGRKTFSLRQRKDDFNTISGLLMTKESSFEIGCIGGGQMGEALVKGLLKAGLYQASSLLVSEPNAERTKYLRDTYKIVTCDTTSQVWQKCNTVLLAV